MRSRIRSTEHQFQRNSYLSMTLVDVSVAFFFFCNKRYKEIRYKEIRAVGVYSRSSQVTETTLYFRIRSRVTSPRMSRGQE